MAQLIVRNIEDEVKEALRRLAASHGRSMEEEIRQILRGAVRADDPKTDELGLGSRIAAMFRGMDLKQEEIPELRGFPVRPAGFDE